LSADEDIDVLRDDILIAMTKVEDSTYRIVLSLMLRVIAAQQKLLKEMVDRLDTVIEDEQRIKEIVLNGHLGEHTRHHDFIGKHFTNSDEFEYAINWAATKMREERESSSENKRFMRRSVERIIITSVMFLLGFHASKLIPHLFGG
jgi:sirohydrochlorin ferrochelatase